MSISELTASRLPRNPGVILARRLQLASMRLQKRQARAERQARRLLRAATANIRSQYYLTTAYSDLRRAATRNEDVLIAAIICSFVLGYTFATWFGRFLLLSFRSMMAVSDSTGISMALLTLVILGVTTVSTCWMMTLFGNLLSLSLMDGANYKRLVSLRATFRRSLRAATRVATTWLALLGMTAAWVVVVLLSALIISRLPGVAVQYTLAICAWAIVPAGLGMLYILGTYGLAPQVALFEPELLLMDRFSRSRQLMRRHGRLFVLGLFATMALAITAFYELQAWLHSLLDLELGLLVGIEAFIVVLFGNCLLAMLYRKRRHAKKP